jgi:hypothetical protein
VTVTPATRMAARLKIRKFVTVALFAPVRPALAPALEGLNIGWGRPRQVQAAG